MAARHVELGLSLAGVSGHEPSVARRLEIVREERPLLRRRLRGPTQQADECASSDGSRSGEGHAWQVDENPEVKGEGRREKGELTYPFSLVGITFSAGQITLNRPLAIGSGWSERGRAASAPRCRPGYVQR